MAETGTKKDMNVMYFVIYCAIVALGWIIPPIDPITSEGMKLLGVFVAAIFGWTATNSVWVSLFTFALIPFTGITNFAGQMAVSWGSDTILFMTLLLAFSKLMEDNKTTDYIAAYIMTNKFIVGHPWRLMFAIYFICWVISIFCGNLVGMMIAWSFVYKICDILGYKPHEKFSNLLVFGVGVVSALSLSSMPFTRNALVILAAYTASSGEAINYAHYLCYSLPYVFFSLMGYMLMCKYLFKMDTSKLKELKPEFFSAEEKTLTKERAITLAALVILILSIIIPTMLPKTNIINIVSTKMGLSLKAFLMFGILTLIRVDGKPMCNLHKLISTGVPWNMHFMVIGILVFVGFIGSEQAGISAFLTQIIAPIFANVSPYTFLILVAVVTVAMTNVMLNMAVAAIMIAIAVPIAGTMGIEALQVVYLITISCTIAFLMPMSSSAGTLLFGNTEWVRPAMIFKYGVPSIIMMTIVAVVWNVILFMF